jgi:uncharacterized protein YceK
MARASIVAVAMLALLPVTGCGTLANFPPTLGSGSAIRPERVYGGVRMDLYWISSCIIDPEPEPLLRLLFLPLYVLDLPFSAIMDTLTLPRTIQASLGRLRGSNVEGGRPPGVNPLPSPSPTQGVESAVSRDFPEWWPSQCPHLPSLPE